MSNLLKERGCAEQLAACGTSLRVGHVFLNSSRRRLKLLNETARQLHREGIPFISIDAAQGQVTNASGEPATEAELPLLIALREGRPAEAFFRVTHPEKPPCVVCWSAAPLRDARHQVLGIVGSVSCGPPEPDWPAMAGLAHDLRTPLNAIGLLITALGMPSSSEAERQELLAALRAASERALRVGTDLLEWCRHRARGGRGVAPSWFALEPFLESLAREQLPAARRKGLVLEIDLAACRHWEAYLDMVRLGRLLANLLVNAVRYTPGGTVIFNAAWRGEGEERELAVGVVDTGTGISSEEQESIFQPFERGRAGKEGDSEGSGLGLAVVEHLVEELGLTLDVYSEYGRGSAFHLQIPGRLLRPSGSDPGCEASTPP